MPGNCERRVQAAKQGIEPDSKGFDAQCLISPLFVGATSVDYDL